MSRRQRKKTSTRVKERKQAHKKLKGLWWKLALGLVVLLVAGAFFAYNRAIAFLHSETFRKDVSAQVGAELGSVGEFGDFKWNGLSAKNDSFKSTGEGAISKINAADIALDVKLDYFKRDKFRLKNVNVSSLNAEIDLRKDFLKFTRTKKEKGFLESLLPDEVELLDAKIGELNAAVHTDSGSYAISGVNLETVKDDDSYKAVIDGGMVELPFSFLETARLEKGEIVQLDDEIYVKDTKLKIFESGTVILNGVVDLSLRARHLYDMEGVLSGLRCKNVLPSDWHRHLTGEVRGKFKVKPHEGTVPRIAGWLEIQNGTLQALPILNKVSYYLAEPRYRTLHFEKFDCEFEKFKDEIYLRKIVLASRELVKIEGDLRIDGRNLDGLFDVGVPASYLAKIPGAKNGVFKPGKDDLLWTKVRIGGNFDDITEDLSDRLISAATQEMIDRALSMGGEAISPETIEKIIKGGGEVKKNLDEVLKGDKGLLEGGVNTAKGLLEGIRGSIGKDGKDKNKGGKKGGEKKEGKLIPDIPKIPLPFL